MADVMTAMQNAFRAAMVQILGEDGRLIDPLIRPAGDSKFGDYQSNCAMSLAKKVGEKPRDLAEKLVASMPADHPFEKMEVAGPGFINLTLKTEQLNETVRWLYQDPRLAVPLHVPQTVVVDYSGPNVAKEMHVGHLRSSVIGDAIVRVLAFQGHDVIRQNHLGDWGTQFGMLIEYLIDQDWDAQSDRTISDLNLLYQQAKQRDDADADFARRARERVVLLQSGDAQSRSVWEALVAESKRHFDHVYKQMGVLLTDEDIRPESAYNADLPDVLDALKEADALKESEGAMVAYPPGFKDREGEPMPMIVRKKDGGFLYATTDLAALRYRIETLKASRIIYVTDSRQRDHFGMVFATANALLHWTQGDPPVRLDHVPFGTVLGSDRKPFKTREGGTVRLTDLLEEAVRRAEGVIEQKNPDLPDEIRKQVAQVVGIGAVKYFDLATDRVKDYVFDWSRMLALDGNTAPYLINAYVRIRSIFRKGALDPRALDAGTFNAAEPEERQLVLHLIQFPAIVSSVADTLEPHRLCNYLYELAAQFHRFYEQCPVLIAEDAHVRESRLVLCEIVSRTLANGMELLGLQTVEQM